MLNIRKFFNGIRIFPKTSSGVDSQGEMDVTSSDGKLHYHNGTSPSPVVTEAHSATLTNKNLDDSTTTVTDTVDPTIAVKIDAAGTTGTSTTIASSQTANRVVTLPDATDTLVGKATTDTLTNKTIDAGSNTITNLTNSNLSGSAAISNANLAPMAAHTFKANNTGSPATPVDITATQATAELDDFVGDSGSGGTKGLVPAPSAGDAAAGKFLKADGTFQTPPNPGGTVNTIGTFDGQPASADGLTISGNSLYAQSADATHPGMVNNTTQTLSGAKTFSTSVKTPLLSDNGAGLSITSSTNQDISISPAGTGNLKLNAPEGVDMQQISTPVNPPSSYNSLYFKSDDQLYSKNSSGAETLIGSNGGGGGSSGLNFLTLDSSFQPTKPNNSTAESSLGDWVAYNNGSGTIAQSLTNNSSVVTVDPARWIGQSFIPGFSTSIQSVTFKLSHSGTISGNAFIKIYNDSSGTPGSVIGTSDAFNSSTLTGTLTPTTFTFSTPPAITSGNTYYAILDVSSVTLSPGNGIQIAVDSTNPYASGSEFLTLNSGSTWSSGAPNDLYFDIESIPLSLTLTGGSPTITLSRTTTSGEVLDGAASFKVVKTAANSENQGISCVANIPLGYRGQNSAFSFPFKVISGSLVQGDLKVVAYDITNSQLIYPVNTDIISTGLISSTLPIPGNTTQIRFGINFASTSASAVTYTIDDVQIGPQALTVTTTESGYIGQVVTLSTTNLPVGTLLCDGSAVSRSQYAKLFDAIGTAYGIGDGSTTFNIPDFRGLFLRGQDQGSGNDPDAASRTATNSGNSGDNIGSVQADDVGPHTHVARGAGLSAPAGASFVVYDAGGTNNTIILNSGTDIGNETRPKNVYVRYAIIYETQTIITQDSQSMSIAGILANGTRITGTAPTQLGQYRSYLRNAGASTFTEVNGSPTAAPSVADGIKIYTASAYSSGDANNNPSKYEIFVGKNKKFLFEFYQTTSRTGFIDCSVVNTGSSYGLVRAYDSATGILSITQNLLTGAGLGTGIDPNSSVAYTSAYFDAFISDQVVPIQVTDSNPAGTITMYGGATAPFGYLLCDGSAISRTNYFNLYTSIGTAYGIGDGSTTFNLPDLRGMFVRGVDHGAGNDPDASSRTATNGGNSGDAVGSVQTDDVGPHNHNLIYGGISQASVTADGAVNTGNFHKIANGGNGSFNSLSVDNTGTGIGTETRPKNVYVNYIIKY